jgi:hypothetical protein
MKNIKLCIEIFNKIQRVNTGDRVEELLDIQAIDEHNAINQEKRLCFSTETELLYLMATMAVTRYKLKQIDLFTGLIFFEILEIGGYKYTDKKFQQQFKDFALIELPPCFCLEIKNLNMLRTTNDRLNQKHGYTTLFDLSNAKPDRTEKMMQLWKESGLQTLKCLCHFNMSNRLAHLGRSKFWEEITNEAVK